MMLGQKLLQPALLSAHSVTVGLMDSTNDIQPLPVERFITKTLAVVLTCVTIRNTACKPVFGVPALFAVLTAPAGILQPMLLVFAMVASGIAQIFPLNFLTFAIGCGSIIGYLNMAIIRAAKFRSALRHQRQEMMARAESEGTVERDDDVGLLILTLTTLAASIVGALP
mmetsp:Transcript_7379/g.12419  ORF Transcript_7379/g.12419 Transcript_7379/m.12419 type:complete len:169 (+) Transcript_7379:64-570(+)